MSRVLLVADHPQSQTVYFILMFQHQGLECVRVTGAHPEDDLKFFFPAHAITLYNISSSGGRPSAMSRAMERSSSSVDILTSFASRRRMGHALEIPGQTRPGLDAGETLALSCAAVST